MPAIHHHLPFAHIAARAAASPEPGSPSSFSPFDLPASAALDPLPHAIAIAAAAASAAAPPPPIAAIASSALHHSQIHLPQHHQLHLGTSTTAPPRSPIFLSIEPSVAPSSASTESAPTLSSAFESSRFAFDAATAVVMTPHPPSSAYSHLSAYGRGHASMSLPSSLPSSPSRTPPAPAHLQTASYPLPPPSTASIATSTTSQPTSSGLEPGLLAKSTPGSAALAPATTALAQPSLAPASAHPARQPAPASVAGSSTSGVSLAALQTPDPNRPFTCPYVDCYKSYKNSNGLKYHLIHVHREYPASSGIASGSSLGGSSAGESGSTTAVLNTSPHPSAIYIHPSERYYHCPVQTPVCGKTYRSAGGLKYHMRTFHRNLSDGERRQYVAYARSRAEWRMPTEAEAAGTVPLVQPPRLAAHTDAPQLMLPLQLHTLSISTSSVLSSGAATPAAVVSMEMPHSPLTMRAAWPDLGMHSAPSSASATTFTAHSQDQHQHQQHFDQAMPHLHLHPVSPLPDGLHTPLVAPPADPSQPVPMQWQFPAPPDHPGPRHYGER